ncbi:Abi family protein [Kribbella sp. NPDC059898]|uniref:Abi family protein n=1 Tax=Kribbella sp. NPDC059898 TaxID=3346995 RepID=UPI003669CE6F
MQPPVQPALSHGEFESWLSQPRADRYLSHCNGDIAVAIELYFWNSRLAAAAFSDTCHLEVALRNAYDRQLSARYPDWAVDPASDLFTRTQGIQAAVRKQAELNRRSQQALVDARRGLGSNPQHGKVVAAMTFGFWTKMTDHPRTALFWNPMLSRAFAGSPQRAAVHELVSRINKFRNRLAHNEPVFSTRTGLHDRLADAEALLNLISPATAAVVKANSPVPAIMASCPVSNLV